MKSVRVFRGKPMIIKNAAAREYDMAVQMWISQNKQSLERITKEIALIMEQGLQLKIMAYFCFSRKQIWTQENKVKQCDTNNRIKPLLDAVALAIGVDDRHFFSEEHEKIETDEDPHVMVAIGTHKPAQKKNLWIANTKDVDFKEKPLVN